MEEKKGKTILEAPIGAVGSAILKWVEGKLKGGILISWKGLSLEIAAGVDSDLVIDAVTQAIPGQIDDAIGEVAKKAIKLI